MKRHLFVCIFFLSSISSFAAIDESAPLTSLPAGSLFRFAQNIDIPANRASVFFIGGRVVFFPTEKSLNTLESFCYLTVQEESEEVRTMATDAEIHVTGVDSTESADYGYTTRLSFDVGLISSISCVKRRSFPTLGDLIDNTSSVFEITQANGKVVLGPRGEKLRPILEGDSLKTNQIESGTSFEFLRDIEFPANVDSIAFRDGFQEAQCDDAMVTCCQIWLRNKSSRSQRFSQGFRNLIQSVKVEETKHSEEPRKLTTANHLFVEGTKILAFSCLSRNKGLTLGEFRKHFNGIVRFSLPKPKAADSFHPIP